MKRVILIFALCWAQICAPTFATANPMFGEYQNQAKIYGGSYVGDTQFERASVFAMAEYAQPVTFLRLPARVNLHAGLSSGTDITWTITGGSLDVVLLSSGRFYAGAGMGIFYRNKQTMRLSSRFTFGERGFIGYRISDKLSTEIFVQHFSNGDITDRNLGYNFAGVGMVWNF